MTTGTGNNVSLFLTDHYIRFPLTLQSAAQAKSGSSIASRQQLLFNYFVPTVEYFVGLANIFSIIWMLNFPEARLFLRLDCKNHFCAVIKRFIKIKLSVWRPNKLNCSRKFYKYFRNYKYFVKTVTIMWSLQTN